jgi:hypothetical protein
MTVFKITRKKVTFGGAPQPPEEYKKNLRKKMKKRNQRDLHRRFLLV